MGKMLDTLKQSESRRGPLAINKPEEAPVQDCVTDWEIAEEVPFIEVGGPGKKVELSPALVKHPPQAAPRAPHLAPEPAARPIAVRMTAARPMSVGFEPWPAPAAPAAKTVSAEIIAFHQPDHPASKEYANLLRMLDAGMKTDGPGVALLTGLKPAVGATTVLVNLAVSAAKTPGRRVMLLDGHAEPSDLADRLGKSAAAGFADVLAGSVALEQAIVKTEIGGLHLLAVGGASKSRPAFTTQVADWLFGWLRQRYDLILIDGPNAQNADLAPFLPHTAGVYLVLPRGAATAEQDAAAQSLRANGGRLCGLIHTHFEL